MGSITKTRERKVLRKDGIITKLKDLNLITWK